MAVVIFSHLLNFSLEKHNIVINMNFVFIVLLCILND